VESKPRTKTGIAVPPPANALNPQPPPLPPKPPANPAKVAIELGGRGGSLGVSAVLAWL